MNFKIWVFGENLEQKKTQNQAHEILVLPLKLIDYFSISIIPYVTTQYRNIYNLKK